LRAMTTNPIIACAALGWVAFLLFWGIGAIRSKSMKGSRNWILAITMVVALFGLFLLLRRGSIPKSVTMVLWNRPLAMGIVSVVIEYAGLLLLIWARRALGSSWSARVETTSEHEFVQQGPYAHVRHPMYSGFLLMVLGSAMAYGRLLGIVILAAFAVGFYLKAMREEAILQEKYGSAYSLYKSATKRFIPYVF
jgi:protein-S-isoprenylcysteine O-methyltransferase Ste14